MSNRSMLEFNHDACPPEDEEQLLLWAKCLRSYLWSADERLLPPGVTFFAIRHHSDPCPLGEPPQGWDNEKRRFAASH